MPPLQPEEDQPAGQAGRRAATALEQELVEQVLGSGPLGMDQLMQAALYHPRHGYYTTRSPLGAAGDFITAPEVSQMFGELIGLWLAARWQELGAPASVQLVELGPGRGTLMADTVRAARVLPAFRAAIQVHLVELNPHLREAQARALDSAGVPVTWHDSLDAVPAGPTLLVANEFLDCLPVRQFVWQGGHWREKVVGVRGGRLAAGLGPPAPLPDPGGRLAAVQLPEGAVIEVMPGLDAFVSQLAVRAGTAPLSALVIDYGSSRSGPGDSVQALWRHTKVGPLDRLGEADLTAHVDFERLLQLGQAAGLQPAGPVIQGAFLMALGLEARASTLIRANPSCTSDVMSAVERLAGEAYMGALFKVACLSSPGLAPPPGIDGTTAP